MNAIAVLVECILLGAVVVFCVLWLRGGDFEPHAATAAAVLALVEWIRRRSSSRADAHSGGKRGSAANENEAEYTDSIPLTTQTLSLCFEKGGHTGPLTMRDGCQARAAVQMDWRVINPYLFAFSTEGHPLDGLVPKFLSRLRGYLEDLEVSNARAQRRDIERAVRKELLSEFKKCGIELESVTIGAIEQLPGPKG